MNATEARIDDGILLGWACGKCKQVAETRDEADACCYDGSDLASASLPTIKDDTGNAWRVGLGMHVIYDGMQFIVDGLDDGCELGIQLYNGTYPSFWVSGERMTPVIANGRPVYEVKK